MPLHAKVKDSLRKVPVPERTKILVMDDELQITRVLRASLAMQLRKKIELGATPLYILTEPRIGYRFRPEAN
jgi:hypothetical protein